MKNSKQYSENDTPHDAKNKMERNRATVGGRVLTVMCSAAFMVPFMGSSLNLALPDIGDEFGMRAVSLSWMVTAYIISTAVFQIPLARVADMVGRRRVFEWGLAGFALFTVASGFAPSGTVLTALRALSGVCSAMIFGTNMAILTASFPPERRGRVLGVNSAVVYAALAAGPFVGGVITHYMGWRSLFFVCGVAGAAVFALSRLFLGEEWRVRHAGRFDLAGSVIYGAAIFCLIFGFTRLPRLYGFALTAAGMAGLWLLVRYERRQAAPVLDVRLFGGNRIFALSSLSALINYAANAATAFMLSLYLQYVRGYDARTAGLVLICQACVQSLFALWSGRLSDRVAPSRLATTGMALGVLGLGGLFLVVAETPVWMIIALLVVLGAGFGIFSSPNTNVIMGSVEARSYGQASAVTGTMRLAGQSFSMAIAAMAIALEVGNRKITPELHPQFIDSMHITFGIFAALCLVGVYASSRRGR